MNYLIVGPQGSGKGTQGGRISETLGLHIIEMGAVLRAQAAKDTVEGQALRATLKSGNLLPNDVINQTVKSEVESIGLHDNLLFDGYPRREPQWIYLRDWFAKLNKKIVAINLELDDEHCIKRLKNRVMSRATGKIFNYESDPPPKNWPADDLFVREDDQPESVKHRLELYHLETQPLLKLYEREATLVSIDASGSIDEVFALILSELKKRDLMLL